MKRNLTAGDLAPHPAHTSPESGPSADETKRSRERESSSPQAQAQARAEAEAPAAVRITSPDSLLAIVPHLLTFQPASCLVVIGTAPPRALVKVTLRYDLPDPPDPEIAMGIARHAISVLNAQRIETAVAVGYGPGPLVAPMADALRARADETRLRINELLRAEDQRYWSYLCSDPACCPPEGTPYDAHDPAAEAMADSGKPILASRDELAATLAPVTGDDAELMQAATRRAEEHVVRLIERARRAGRRGSARRLIGVAGVEAVTEAIAACRRGERFPAGDCAAWLTVVLHDLRVRDDAWCRMKPEHKDEHLRLWTDLTRFAAPGYIAAPAALLAFVAWQAGNGALANVALDRALSDDPGYTMAELLRQAIDSGAPPSLATIPMTPEQVAASYEAAYDDDEDLTGDDPVGEDPADQDTADRDTADEDPSRDAGRYDSAGDDSPGDDSPGDDAAGNDAARKNGDQHDESRPGADQGSQGEAAEARGSRTDARDEGDS